MEVIDKMAQEFDDWYNAVGVWRDASRQDLWLAWQASRSALCVELPESECGGDGYYYEDGLARGHNDCLELVQSVLDDVGVSHK